MNQRFDVPLNPNEVKHIIRSIARYCARMDFTASYKAFSKLQATRGAKGGRAKGKSYDEKRQQAKELYEQGLNKSEIARRLGVSRRSVINWLSNLGCENSHNQIIARLAVSDAARVLAYILPAAPGTGCLLRFYATLFANAALALPSCFLAPICFASYPIGRSTADPWFS